MRVTLQSEDSSRNPSSRGRTSCSGRSDGALNLGVRTILRGSTSGSLEELIANPALLRLTTRLARSLVGTRSHQRVCKTLYSFSVHIIHRVRPLPCRCTTDIDYFHSQKDHPFVFLGRKPVGFQQPL